MIKAGIIGATGYAGEELIRILTNHPDVEIKYISSRTYEGKPYNEVFPNYYGIVEDRCVSMSVEDMAEDCDAVFLALPHGLSFGQVNSGILKKTVIIDLGADFRIKDPVTYGKWYGLEHTNHEMLAEAVYGLCELHREEIRDTSLIANPGCYTTCSILSLYPAVKEGIIDPSTIIIDAKSGVSGAGRALSTGTHYAECNESVKAYKIASHRHTPEIEQELSAAAGKELVLNFTPHLIPMNRGILATCYASLNGNISEKEIFDIYRDYYKDEYFIRLLKPGQLPETRFVRYSNFTDIGLVKDERTNRVIIAGAIDNLIKGAAGQAVQNMNIRFGLEETAGLETIPLIP